uniref:anthranilate phosphoribosyltransferase n=1 Tax=Tetraselmis chuii TaxID=63592 RepID=A0A7S1WZY8_9CHLO|eukprot:CAMPEP_0177755670 /NCGR_PEP_ID=MMETSP0491_2-20121128/2691_1 /TAXON_ID=63592 /ORGANISM="Tetraselmis chuii, Strain PLY429" /LENGTH=393 /DNA_ID=CAMNT_0019271185 /DNA_START=63 /DNA_END=1244 /DNA_ORIENTATION=+
MASLQQLSRPTRAAGQVKRGRAALRAPPARPLPSLALNRRTRSVCALSANGAATEVNIRMVLEMLMDKEDLSEGLAQGALQVLLENGEQPQMAAFLTLLRAKGETASEIAGLARAMRAAAIPVHTPYDVVDIVGTGGDDIGSVNISTGSSVIAAAAGAKVAKHGNRSVSSLCGSADVLEALGVVVDLGPEEIAECLEETGIAFMFAPRFHPAMKAVVPVRKSLKVRTAFNFLGPMLNPADAKYALVGVYDTSVSRKMAEALMRLDMKKALVVHSHGLDELTPMGDADVVEVTPEGVKHYILNPRDLGIPACTVEDLKGGDAQFNAQVLRDVFAGQRGAVADALCLNAGVALAAAQVASSPEEGVAMAQEVQRSGKALQVLETWVATSQRLSVK